MNDDSTMFWAVGYDNGVIAKHAEFCGQEVEMVVPFEGVSSSEVYILTIQVCLCIMNVQDRFLKPLFVLLTLQVRFLTFS